MDESAERAEVVCRLAQVITLIGSSDLANHKAGVLQYVDPRVANYGPIMDWRGLLLLRLVVMMVMMIVLQAVG